MRIAICGYYGMGNIGDEAIKEGLKLTVNKIWPKSEIAVMGRDNLFSVGIRSFLKMLTRPQLLLKPLRILKSCDIFILGGGGLFTDEETPFVSLFWALQGLIALLLKKPLLIIGVSTGKMGIFNKWIVKQVVKRAKLVMVRDKQSQKIFEKMGIKAYLGCDFATVAANEAKQSCVGLLRPIQGRPRNDNGNNNKYIVISLRRFKNLNENLYTKIARFCDSAIEKYGLNIRLIPFQSGDKNDCLILNKIFEQVKRKDKISVEKFYDDINELIAILSNAKVVIAMRLHAGILSAISGTPFLPLPYMEKVNAFWQDFPDIKPIGLSEITDGQLFARFSEMYEDYERQKSYVQDIQKTLLEKINITEEILTENKNSFTSRT